MLQILSHALCESEIPFHSYYYLDRFLQLVHTSQSEFNLAEKNISKIEEIFECFLTIKITSF